MTSRRSDEPSSLSRRWSPLTKQIVVVGGLVAAVWLVFRFSSILSPLIISLMLAYILTPMVNWIHHRIRIPRWIILLCVYLLLLVALTLTPALVIPGLIDQFTDLQLDLQSVTRSTIEWLTQPIRIFDYTIEIPNYYDQITKTLEGLVSPFASGAVSVVVGVASSLAWLIFILVVSFYLVKDSARIDRYMKGLIPLDYRVEILELVTQVNMIWHAFFRGQIILGLIMGITVAVVVSALGLSNGLMLGLLAGVLEIVPTIGPTIAAVPAIFLALFQGSSYIPVSNLWFAVIVAGVYAIIHQIENNYLVPRIIGRSVKLHPAVIIVGALIGATVGGILGILLAAPVIGTLRVVIKYAYRKTLDLEPFGDVLTPVIEPVIHHAGMIGGQEIDAVLFDLDGTLIDTDDELVENLANRLQRIESLLPTGDAHRSARRTIMASEKPANALLTMLDKVGLDDQSFSLRDRLNRLKGQPPAEDFRLIEGVTELLDHLDGRFKLGIVTTRSQPEVEAFLEQYGYHERFQAIITRDDVERLKPHPESILKAAELLDVPVARCAMVGDTRVDVEAANAAGAVSVGVLSGFSERDDLLDADLILESTPDLRMWL
jgi:HAD superfamily hydrolase (TIGR01509 family)